MDDCDEQMRPAEFETIKKLILLQLRRIEEAETFEEAKVINKELLSALR